MCGDLLLCGLQRRAAGADCGCCVCVCVCDRSGCGRNPLDAMQESSARVGGSSWQDRGVEGQHLRCSKAREEVAQTGVGLGGEVGMAGRGVS